MNKIECALDCEIPGGMTAEEVPVPRHAWSDVVVCPNGVDEGLEAPCGRAFMVRKVEERTPAQHAAEDLFRERFGDRSPDDVLAEWSGHIGQRGVIEPSCGCPKCTAARFNMEVK